MYFRDIVGHDSLKAQLLTTARQGLVPHAQLFTGRDGEGALGLAYAYARYLNCADRGEWDACGHCPSCRRYDEVGDPDLSFLYPIVNASGKNLCEDHIEDWRRFIQKGPYTYYDEWLGLLGGDGKKASIFAREGEPLQRMMGYQTSGRGYRILIIWLPERMQEALGNKLLKLVEEPPERTVILMVTMDEPSVLQTLRSRMQTLRLRPLTEPEIETALRATPTDYAEADALYAAHLSEGNYRKALDLYEGRAAELGEEYALLQRILRATVNAQPREMKLLAEDLAALSKEEQASLLEYLARMFREFYLYNLSLPDINYLTSREEGIARYLRSCITGRNVRQVEAEIDEAARHLAQNVQAKMVFFDLILRLTSTLAPSYKQAGVR